MCTCKYVYTPAESDGHARRHEHIARRMRRQKPVYAAIHAITHIYACRHSHSIGVFVEMYPVLVLGGEKLRWRQFARQRCRVLRYFQRDGCWVMGFRQCLEASDMEDLSFLLDGLDFLGVHF